MRARAQAVPEALREAVPLARALSTSLSSARYVSTTYLTVRKHFVLNGTLRDEEHFLRCEIIFLLSYARDRVRQSPSISGCFAAALTRLPRNKPVGGQR